MLMEVKDIMEQQFQELKNRVIGQKKNLIYMESDVCPICKGTGYEF